METPTHHPLSTLNEAISLGLHITDCSRAWGHHEATLGSTYYPAVLLESQSGARPEEEIALGNSANCSQLVRQSASAFLHEERRGVAIFPPFYEPYRAWSSRREGDAAAQLDELLHQHAELNDAEVSRRVIAVVSSAKCLSLAPLFSHALTAHGGGATVQIPLSSLSLEPSDRLYPARNAIDSNPGTSARWKHGADLGWLLARVDAPSSFSPITHVRIAWERGGLAPRRVFLQVSADGEKWHLTDARDLASAPVESICAGADSGANAEEPPGSIVLSVRRWQSELSPIASVVNSLPAASSATAVTDGASSSPGFTLRDPAAAAAFIRIVVSGLHPGNLRGVIAISELSALHRKEGASAASAHTTEAASRTASNPSPPPPSAADKPHLPLATVTGRLHTSLIRRMAALTTAGGAGSAAWRELVLADSALALATGSQRMYLDIVQQLKSARSSAYFSSSHSSSGSGSSIGGSVASIDSLAQQIASALNELVTLRELRSNALRWAGRLHGANAETFPSFDASAKTPYVCLSNGGTTATSEELGSRVGPGASSATGYVMASTGFPISGRHSWAFRLDADRHGDECVAFGFAVRPVREVNYETSQDMWTVRCYNARVYGRQGSRQMSTIPHGAIRRGSDVGFTLDGTARTVSMTVNGEPQGVVFVLPSDDDLAQSSRAARGGSAAVHPPLIYPCVAFYSAGRVVTLTSVRTETPSIDLDVPVALAKFSPLALPSTTTPATQSRHATTALAASSLVQVLGGLSLGCDVPNRPSVGPILGLPRGTLAAISASAAEAAAATAAGGRATSESSSPSHLSRPRPADSTELGGGGGAGGASSHDDQEPFSGGSSPRSSSRFGGIADLEARQNIREIDTRWGKVTQWPPDCDLPSGRISVRRRLYEHSVALAPHRAILAAALECAVGTTCARRRRSLLSASTTSSESSSGEVTTITAATASADDAAETRVCAVTSLVRFGVGAGFRSLHFGLGLQDDSCDAAASSSIGGESDSSGSSADPIRDAFASGAVEARVYCDGPDIGHGVLAFSSRVRLPAAAAQGTTGPTIKPPPKGSYAGTTFALPDENSHDPGTYTVDITGATEITLLVLQRVTASTRESTGHSHTKTASRVRIQPASAGRALHCGEFTSAAEAAAAAVRQSQTPIVVFTEPRLGPAPTGSLPSIAECLRLGVPSTDDVKTAAAAAAAPDSEDREAAAVPFTSIIQHVDSIAVATAARVAGAGNSPSSGDRNAPPSPSSATFEAAALIIIGSLIDRPSNGPQPSDPTTGTSAADTLAASAAAFEFYTRELKSFAGLSDVLQRISSSAPKAPLPSPPATAGQSSPLASSASTAAAAAAAGAAISSAYATLAATGAASSSASTATAIAGATAAIDAVRRAAHSASSRDTEGLLAGLRRAFPPGEARILRRDIPPASSPSMLEGGGGGGEPGVTPAVPASSPTGEHASASSALRARPPPLSVAPGGASSSAPGSSGGSAGATLPSMATAAAAAATRLAAAPAAAARVSPAFAAASYSPDEDEELSRAIAMSLDAAAAASAGLDTATTTEAAAATAASVAIESAAQSAPVGPPTAMNVDEPHGTSPAQFRPDQPLPPAPLSCDLLLRVNGVDVVSSLVLLHDDNGDSAAAVGNHNDGEHTDRSAAATTDRGRSRRNGSDPLLLALGLAHALRDEWLKSSLTALLDANTRCDDNSGSSSSNRAAVGVPMPSLDAIVLRSLGSPPTIAPLYAPLVLEADGHSASVAASLLNTYLLRDASNSDSARNDADAGEYSEATMIPLLLCILLRGLAAVEAARVNPSERGYRSPSVRSVFETLESRLENTVFAPVVSTAAGATENVADAAVAPHAAAKYRPLIAHLAAAALLRGSGIAWHTSETSLSRAVLRCCSGVSRCGGASFSSAAGVALHVTVSLLAKSALSLLSATPGIRAHFPLPSANEAPPSSRGGDSSEITSGSQLFRRLLLLVVSHEAVQLERGGAAGAAARQPLDPLHRAIEAWAKRFQAGLLATALSCIGESAVTGPALWSSCDAPTQSSRVRYFSGGQEQPRAVKRSEAAAAGATPTTTTAAPSHAAVVMTHVLLSHASALHSMRSFVRSDSIVHALFRDALIVIGMLCANVHCAAVALPWLAAHTTRALGHMHRLSDAFSATRRVLLDVSPSSSVLHAPSSFKSAIRALPPPGNRDNFTGHVGTRFRVSSSRPVIAVSLGRSVSNRVNLGRLQRPHVLCLWRQRDQRLLGTAIADDTCPRDAHGFAVASLRAPVALAPGVTYCVTSAEVAGSGDPWYDPAAAGAASATSGSSHSSNGGGGDGPAEVVSAASGETSPPEAAATATTVSTIQVVGDCWRENSTWLSRMGTGTDGGLTGAASEGSGHAAAALEAGGGGEDVFGVTAVSGASPSLSSSSASSASYVVHGTALEYPDRGSSRSKPMGITTFYWKESAAPASAGDGAAVESEALEALVDAHARACASLAAGEPVTELEEHCQPWFQLPIFSMSNNGSASGGGDAPAPHFDAGISSALTTPSPFISLLRLTDESTPSSSATTTVWHEYGNAVASAPPAAATDAAADASFLLALVLRPGGISSSSGGGDSADEAAEGVLLSELSPSDRAATLEWLNVSIAASAATASESPILSAMLSPRLGATSSTTSKSLTGVGEIVEAWLQLRAPEPRLLQRKAKYSSASMSLFAALVKQGNCVGEVRSAVALIIQRGLAESPVTLSAELARAWARTKTFRKWLRSQASTLRAALDESAKQAASAAARGDDSLDSDDDDGEGGPNSEEPAPASLLSSSSRASNAAAATAAAAAGPTTGSSGGGGGVRASTTTADAASGTSSASAVSGSGGVAPGLSLTRGQLQEQYAMALHRRLQRVRRRRCIEAIPASFEQLLRDVRERCLFMLGHAAATASSSPELDASHPSVAAVRFLVSLQQQQQQQGAADVSVQGGGEGEDASSTSRGAASAGSGADPRALLTELAGGDAGGLVVLYARHGAVAPPLTLATCALKRRDRASQRVRGLDAQCELMRLLGSSAESAAPIPAEQLPLFRAALRYLPAALRGRDYGAVIHARATVLAIVDAAARAALSSATVLAVSSARASVLTAETAPAASSSIRVTAQALEYALLDQERTSAAAASRMTSASSTTTGDASLDNQLSSLPTIRRRQVRTLLSLASLGDADASASFPVPLPGCASLIVLPPSLSGVTAAGVDDRRSVLEFNIDGDTSSSSTASSSSRVSVGASDQWCHPLADMRGIPSSLAAHLRAAHHSMLAMGTGWLSRVVAASDRDPLRGSALLPLLTDLARFINSDYLPDDANALLSAQHSGHPGLLQSVSGLLEAPIRHLRFVLESAEATVSHDTPPAPHGDESPSPMPLHHARVYFLSTLASSWAPDRINRELRAGRISKSAVIAALRHTLAGALACASSSSSSPSLSMQLQPGSEVFTQHCARTTEFYGLHGSLTEASARLSTVSLVGTYRRVFIGLRGIAVGCTSSTSSPTDAAQASRARFIVGAADSAIRVLEGSSLATVRAVIGRSIALHLTSIFTHAGLSRRLRSTLHSHCRALVTVEHQMGGTRPGGTNEVVVDAAADASTSSGATAAALAISSAADSLDQLRRAAIASETQACVSGAWTGSAPHSIVSRVAGALVEALSTACARVHGSDARDSFCAEFTLCEREVYDALLSAAFCATSTAPITSAHSVFGRGAFWRPFMHTALSRISPRCSVLSLNILRWTLPRLDLAASSDGAALSCDIARGLEIAPAVSRACVDAPETPGSESQQQHQHGPSSVLLSDHATETTVDTTAAAALPTTAPRTLPAAVTVVLHVLSLLDGWLHCEPMSTRGCSDDVSPFDHHSTATAATFVSDPDSPCVEASWPAFHWAGPGCAEANRSAASAAVGLLRTLASMDRASPEQRQGVRLCDFPTAIAGAVWGALLSAEASSCSSESSAVSDGTRSPSARRLSDAQPSTTERIVRVGAAAAAILCATSATALVRRGGHVLVTDSPLLRPDVDAEIYAMAGHAASLEQGVLATVIGPYVSGQSTLSVVLHSAPDVSSWTLHTARVFSNGSSSSYDAASSVAGTAMEDHLATRVLLDRTLGNGEFTAVQGGGGGQGTRSMSGSGGGGSGGSSGGDISIAVESVDASCVFPIDDVPPPVAALLRLTRHAARVGCFQLRQLLRQRQQQAQQQLQQPRRSLSLLGPLASPSTPLGDDVSELLAALVRLALVRFDRNTLSAGAEADSSLGQSGPLATRVQQQQQQQPAYRRPRGLSAAAAELEAHPDDARIVPDTSALALARGSLKAAALSALETMIHDPDARDALLQRGLLPGIIDEAVQTLPGLSLRSPARWRACETTLRDLAGDAAVVAAGGRPLPSSLAYSERTSRASSRTSHADDSHEEEDNSKGGGGRPWPWEQLVSTSLSNCRVEGEGAESHLVWDLPSLQVLYNGGGFGEGGSGGGADDADSCSWLCVSEAAGVLCLARLPSVCDESAASSSALAPYALSSTASSSSTGSASATTSSDTAARRADAAQREAASVLVAMGFGFDLDACMLALRRHNDDMNRAAEWLLTPEAPRVIAAAAERRAEAEAASSSQLRDVRGLTGPGAGGIGLMGSSLSSQSSPPGAAGSGSATGGGRERTRTTKAGELADISGMPKELCYQALQLLNDDANAAMSWLMDRGLLYVESFFDERAQAAAAVADAEAMEAARSSHDPTDDAALEGAGEPAALVPGPSVMPLGGGAVAPGAAGAAAATGAAGVPHSALAAALLGLEFGVSPFTGGPEDAAGAVRGRSHRHSGHSSAASTASAASLSASPVQPDLSGVRSHAPAVIAMHRAAMGPALLTLAAIEDAALRPSTVAQLLRPGTLVALTRHIGDVDALNGPLELGRSIGVIVGFGPVGSAATAAPAAAAAADGGGVTVLHVKVGGSDSSSGGGAGAACRSTEPPAQTSDCIVLVRCTDDATGGGAASLYAVSAANVRVITYVNGRPVPVTGAAPALRSLALASHLASAVHSARRIVAAMLLCWPSSVPLSLDLLGGGDKIVALTRLIAAPSAEFSDAYGGGTGQSQSHPALPHGGGGAAAIGGASGVAPSSGVIESGGGAGGAAVEMSRPAAPSAIVASADSVSVLVNCGDEPVTQAIVIPRPAASVFSTSTGASGRRRRRSGGVGGGVIPVSRVIITSGTGGHHMLVSQSNAFLRRGGRGGEIAALSTAAAAADSAPSAGAPLRRISGVSIDGGGAAGGHAFSTLFGRLRGLSISSVGSESGGSAAATAVQSSMQQQLGQAPSSSFLPSRAGSPLGVHGRRGPGGVAAGPVAGTSTPPLRTHHHHLRMASFSASAAMDAASVHGGAMPEFSLDDAPAPSAISAVHAISSATRVGGVSHGQAPLSSRAPQSPTHAYSTGGGAVGDEEEGRVEEGALLEAGPVDLLSVFRRALRQLLLTEAAAAVSAGEYVQQHAAGDRHATVARRARFSITASDSGALSSSGMLDDSSASADVHPVSSSSHPSAAPGGSALSLPRIRRDRRASPLPHAGTGGAAAGFTGGLPPRTPPLRPTPHSDLFGGDTAGAAAAGSREYANYSPDTAPPSPLASLLATPSIRAMRGSPLPDLPALSLSSLAALPPPMSLNDGGGSSARHGDIGLDAQLAPMEVSSSSAPAPLTSAATAMQLSGMQPPHRSTSGSHRTRFARLLLEQCVSSLMLTTRTGSSGGASGGATGAGGGEDELLLRQRRIAESVHPYVGRCEYTGEVCVEGAKAIRVMFDPRTELAPEGTNLTFFSDPACSVQIASFPARIAPGTASVRGSSPVSLQYPSVSIQGDRLYYRFASTRRDDADTGWGYRFFVIPLRGLHWTSERQVASDPSLTWSCWLLGFLLHDASRYSRELFDAIHHKRMFEALVRYIRTPGGPMKHRVVPLLTSLLQHPRALSASDPPNMAPLLTLGERVMARVGEEQQRGKSVSLPPALLRLVDLATAVFAAERELAPRREAVAGGSAPSSPTDEGSDSAASAHGGIGVGFPPVPLTFAAAAVERPVAGVAAAVTASDAQATGQVGVPGGILHRPPGAAAPPSPPAPVPSSSGASTSAAAAPLPLSSLLLSSTSASPASAAASAVAAPPALRLVPRVVPVNMPYTYEEVPPLRECLLEVADLAVGFSSAPSTRAVSSSFSELGSIDSCAGSGDGGDSETSLRSYFLLTLGPSPVSIATTTAAAPIRLSGALRIPDTLLCRAWLDAFGAAQVRESAHPYCYGELHSGWVVLPGASTLRIAVDRRTQVSVGCSLRFWTANGDPVPLLGLMNTVAHDAASSSTAGGRTVAAAAAVVESHRTGVTERVASPPASATAALPATAPAAASAEAVSGPSAADAAEDLAELSAVEQQPIAAASAAAPSRSSRSATKSPYRPPGDMKAWLSAGADVAEITGDRVRYEWKSTKGTARGTPTATSTSVAWEGDVPASVTAPPLRALPSGAGGSSSRSTGNTSGVTERVSEGSSAATTVPAAAPAPSPPSEVNIGALWGYAFSVSAVAWRVPPGTRGARAAEEALLRMGASPRDQRPVRETTTALPPASRIVATAAAYVPQRRYSEGGDASTAGGRGAPLHRDEVDSPRPASATPPDVSELQRQQAALQYQILFPPPSDSSRTRAPGTPAATPAPAATRDPRDTVATDEGAFTGHISGQLTTASGTAEFDAAVSEFSRSMRELRTHELTSEGTAEALVSLMGEAAASIPSTAAVEAPASSQPHTVPSIAAAAAVASLPAIPSIVTAAAEAPPQGIPSAVASPGETPAVPSGTATAVVTPSTETPAVPSPVAVDAPRAAPPSEEAAANDRMREAFLQLFSSVARRTPRGGGSGDQQQPGQQPSAAGSAPLSAPSLSSSSAAAAARSGAAVPTNAPPVVSAGDLELPANALLTLDEAAVAMSRWPRELDELLVKWINSHSMKSLVMEDSDAGGAPAAVIAEASHSRRMVRSAVDMGPADVRLSRKEAAFTFEPLARVPPPILMLRTALLRLFNRRVARILDLIDVVAAAPREAAALLSSAPGSGSGSSLLSSSCDADGAAAAVGFNPSLLAAGHTLLPLLFRDVQHVVFSEVKSRIVEQAMALSWATVPRGAQRPGITLDHMRAATSVEMGATTIVTSQSIFVQTLRQLTRVAGGSPAGVSALLRAPIDDRGRIWTVRYADADGIDYGGVWRDSITRVVDDCFSSNMDLLLPVPNAALLEGGGGGQATASTRREGDADAAATAAAVSSATSSGGLLTGQRTRSGAAGASASVTAAIPPPTSSSGTSSSGTSSSGIGDVIDGGASSHSETFLPNPAYTAPGAPRCAAPMLEFLGKLMGMSLRSKLSLPFMWPPLVWKSLAGQQLTFDDLADVDAATARLLQAVAHWEPAASVSPSSVAAGATDSDSPASLLLGTPSLGSLLHTATSAPSDEAQFRAAFPSLTFTARSLDGRTVELLPGGADIVVSLSDREAFVRLTLQYALTAYDPALRLLRRGMYSVAPARAVRLLTGEELEVAVAGRPEIDLKLLRAHTEYEGFRRDDPTILLFWRVLESLTHEERSQWIRFAWGRSRLPTGRRWPKKMKLQRRPCSEASLPISHSCFFSIELPPYSTYARMRQAILAVIRYGSVGILNA